MSVVRLILAFIAVVSMLVPASAQWIKYPTPGIPRTPDGKPNLSAPAPKTRDGKPDFSGIWATRRDTRFFQDLSAGGVDIPMLPWAKALYEERKKNQQRGHPSERCLGHGLADFDTHQTPRRIVQSPGVIAILFESYHQYRQILMDGRPLPEVGLPAYLGYSVGRWEGDTLVIETVGVNDKGWLDMNGHPQTEKTHFTERLRRPTFGHIDVELTIDDPSAYSRSWTVKLPGWEFLPDTDLIEAICENERDASHVYNK